MKKLLIRSGMSPLLDIPIKEVVQYNRIGDNVGNLVYIYSVFRSLMTEDVELVPNYYRITSLKPEEINEQYDAFVIPLADALRNSFISELTATTEFIKKLTIPCYVLGMGVRGNYDYQTKGLKFSHDDLAYEFIKAVLEKSSIIGIRGEITAEYLKKLGFIPEKDFTVIGCPSMYAFGNDLQVKKLSLNENSRIAINNNVVTGEEVQNFLTNICKKYYNHTFFPQRINELRTLYFGCDYRHKTISPGYPDNIRYKIYKEDKVRFYTHVYHWIKKLSTMDLSVGPRLHGNVASILAGTPALFIMHDARMRELVDYHNLPHLYSGDIKPSTSLNKVVENIDFASFLKGHKARFEHYVDFLNKNGISNIFKDYKNPQNAPFDQKLKELEIEEKNFSVKSVLRCSNTEIIERFNEIYDSDKMKPYNIIADEGIPSENEVLKNNIFELKSELKDIKREMSDVNEELKRTRGELKEATHGFWYLCRRKISSYLKKKKTENNVESEEYLKRKEFVEKPVFNEIKENLDIEDIEKIEDIEE